MINGVHWEVGSTWYSDESFLRNYSDRQFIETIGRNTYLPSEHISLISTCRSAIGEILDSVKASGKALVPGFTCHSVIDPFIKRGIEVIPYGTNRDLTINSEDLNDKISKYDPDIIFLHGYFGFDTLSSAESGILWQGINEKIIIEDKTQTMFSELPEIFTIHKVGSIRKWFPIPDGAFISCGGDHLNRLKEDKILKSAKERAFNLKYDFLKYGKGYKSEFQRIGRQAESILDSRTETYKISNSSTDYLSKINLKEVNNRRRENYRILVSHILKHPDLEIIFPSLNEGIVPFMLPVLVGKQRSEFQKFMASNNVYPTVIWSCPDSIKGKIDNTTKEIYDSILCFHIDQRYESSDMNIVGDIIDKYFEG